MPPPPPPQDDSRHSDAELEAIIESRVSVRLREEKEKERREKLFTRVASLEAHLEGAEEELSSLRNICKQLDDKVDTFASGSTELAMSLEEVEKGQLSKTTQRKVYAAAGAGGGGLAVLAELMRYIF